MGGPAIGGCRAGRAPADRRRGRHAFLGDDADVHGTSTGEVEVAITAAVPGAVRVVVADDNAVFRGGMTRAIELDPRFELVGEGEDGDEAVQLIRELRPDIAILDLSMPRSGGLQVAQALAAEGPAATRLVLLTAMLEPPIAARARALGFVGALSKDLSRVEILDAVCDWGQTP
jgi:two-component system nitrate/nitrite response regulator NarL